MDHSDQDVCEKLLNLFEAAIFVKSGDIREIASSSAIAPDLNKEQVFGRIFQMLHFVSQQFWEGKKDQLLSTLRGFVPYSFNRSAAEAFKTMLWRWIDEPGLTRLGTRRRYLSGFTSSVAMRGVQDLDRQRVSPRFAGIAVSR